MLKRAGFFRSEGNYGVKAAAHLNMASVMTPLKTGPKTRKKIQNSFLHLFFRYLISARDFLPIVINFNVKIKGYDVSHFYQCFFLNFVHGPSPWAQFPN